jgi:hypothetical protein
MLLLPALASCRFLSTGVNLQNHVRVVSGHKGPDVEFASGMKPNDEPCLLTHDLELLRKDLFEVLTIKHWHLDQDGRSSAA